MMGDVSIERDDGIHVYVEGFEHPHTGGECAYESYDVSELNRNFGVEFNDDEAVMVALNEMGMLSDVGLSYIEGEMRCEIEDY